MSLTWMPMANHTVGLGHVIERYYQGNSILLDGQRWR